MLQGFTSTQGHAFNSWGTSITVWGHVWLSQQSIEASVHLLGLAPTQKLPASQFSFSCSAPSSDGNTEVPWTVRIKNAKRCWCSLLHHGVHLREMKPFPWGKLSFLQMLRWLLTFAGAELTALPFTGLCVYPTESKPQLLQLDVLNQGPCLRFQLIIKKSMGLMCSIAH